MTNQPFIWGKTDCHQLLYQFVNLTNPTWDDPYNLAALEGTYSTKREAREVAKTLKIAEWFEELNYEARPRNILEVGDVVWVPNKNQKTVYDMYWPVVLKNSVLVGDPTTSSIKIRHIDELRHYDFQVYRRRECQQQ